MNWRKLLGIKPKPRDLVFVRIDEQLSDRSKAELEVALKDFGIRVTAINTMSGSGFALTKDLINKTDMVGISKRLKELDLELYEYKYHA
jgi:hypothetical protein